MLYIFDRDEKVVGFLQSNSDRNKNIYYNDVLTEILSSGADSFAFTAISDRDTSKNLTVGNYIAFKKGNKFKLMQIMEVNESRENALTKEIYCESAGLELINTVYSGSKMPTVNIESFLKNVLQDTNWEVGYIDSNLTKTLTLEIEEKEVYSIIQEYLYDFEAEIDFRVEIKGNRIVGRYIDVYSKRGRNNGRRLEINRDIKSISRKVSLTEYATKLIGEGKNGLNFRDISMSGEINKPLGQNFVVNEEAYSRINNKGKHITRKFTYDTEDAYELLRQTYKALKEYSEPKVTYEVDADILNFDDIEIGDYVSISDLSFTPPLLVTARISELETSKTNKYANKAILSNFNEVRSGISSIFPIPGDNIVSGSISGDQMNPDYVDSIISDSVNASMVKTEILLADKANISDLNATNATVENLTADFAEIDELLAGNITAENIKADSITSDHIQANTIDTKHLKADSIDANKIKADSIESKHIQSNTIDTNHLKADIIDAEHINANSITSNHIQSNTIDARHINSNSINADHIQANTITSGHIQTGSITAGSGIIADGAIGNAQISKIDAGKIEAGTIDTSKVTIQGANGHLRLKGNRMQVFQGTGNQAKERVSVGDVNGDGSVYGLRVRGADGQTILLDENGVKSEGITDGAITNDKISDDANIDGAKLNINSVVNKINEDGTETIQGTKIEVDGTTLNTKLSTITTKQTENSERISQAQSQITANTNAIKLKVDEQVYTSDKKNMTSKLEKNTSEISTMKGQIALKVEQTDITNAINNLQVGGRNFLTQSDKFNVGVGATGISGIVNSDGTLSITSTSDNGNWYTGWAKSYGVTETNMNEGDIFTISFTMKSSNTTSKPTIYIKSGMGYYSMQGTMSSNWSTIYYTGTWKKANGMSLHLGFYNVAGTIDIKNWKIEKGTKPTDWTPAPEDADNAIAVVDNKVTTTNNKVASIETNLNSITQRVSSTESTVSTHTTQLGTVDNRINTAKNSAISTAANDATTKANNAQTNAKNYTDGQITTVNKTITDKVAEIKTTTDAITSRVSKTEQVATSSLQGKMLYTDLTFKSGNNSINTYNNAGGGTVTVSRVAKSSDCPTTSGYMMQITTTGTASPGHGGFYFGTGTRANAILITKIIAKIPSGCTLNWASNGYGTGGKQEWLTSTAGTGNWQEYICKVTCGTSGTFSSTNFFYLSGGTTPVTWYVAMATVFDITDTSNVESRLSTAEQKITSDAIVSTVTGSTTYQNAMTGKVDKTQIISTINQTAESVKINASKIQLTGDVVCNAVNSGSTTISGSKITTGTITADKIATGAITAGMITTGTLDASKVNVTNLNASNIKSGKLSANYIDATNLSVKGELLSGQINGIGGMKFADGAVISSCESGVSGYKGIQISAPVIKLGDKVEINRPTIFYDVTGKNNSSSKTTTWTMSSSGGLNCSTINTTGTTTVGGTLNVRNNMINGMNNLQMGRGSVYIPIFGTNYTYDYIKGGASRIAFADSGPIHFLYNGSKSSFIAGGTIYLPHAGNVNCDHFRLGAGIMASPSSGSFHFLTASGGTSPLYAGVLYSATALDVKEPMVISNKSVFDKINSINVIETKNGLRLHNPISMVDAIDESPEVVKTVYNEEKDQIETSIDYTSAIAALWKAVQELKQEVEMLKNKNEGEL